ncbi:hypothetical protein HanPSC8_Chr02g0063951 [Helianthus annuus]|nr:hypothetical protein HanPSC8_Chr02g0063951 [Helianthus annuus]
MIHYSNGVLDFRLLERKIPDGTSGYDTISFPPFFVLAVQFSINSLLLKLCNYLEPMFEFELNIPRLQFHCLPNWCVSAYFPPV